MKPLLQSLVFFALVTSVFAAEKQRIIIDADTANEVDDLYAVIRVLIEPSWDVIAVNAKDKL